MTTITESDLEKAAIGWFRELGYDCASGPDIACDGPSPERPDYCQDALPGRLQHAIDRLNSELPPTTRA
jgi:type I restriction enzyme, R subunit